METQKLPSSSAEMKRSLDNLSSGILHSSSSLKSSKKLHSLSASFWSVQVLPLYEMCMIFFARKRKNSLLWNNNRKFHVEAERQDNMSVSEQKKRLWPWLG